MSARRLGVAAFTCALVWATAAVVSADTDVAWISQLPGLSVMTHKTTPSGVKTVYALSGNVNSTVDSVTKGLTERGWTIAKSTSTPVAGIVSRTLQAGKDGALLKISAQDVGGISQLTLTLTGATAAAQVAAAPVAPTTPAPAAPAAPAPAAPAARTESAGLPLALVENRLDGSYDCGNRDVSIAGDHCKVQLEGVCRSLRILGNHNKVAVVGSVRSIQTLGGHNHVTWSAETNASRPKVVNLGNNNKVRSDQE